MSQEPEEIRVGVYVCHCGGNISDVVDVKRVAQELSQYPEVKVATNYMFMCSDPGQQLIIDDIQRNNINRVVVSACSPALHELTFRSALQRAGLNPYLYENVNIREQVSWVHKGNHEGATEKAIRLTKAGVEKIIRQDPLEVIQVNALPAVLVIGAGIAGMRSALALADRGLAVTLVEMTDKMGGRLNEMSAVYPTEQQASDILKDLQDKVLAHTKIAVSLNTKVVGIDGFVGNFTVRVSASVDGSTTDKEIKVGAIVIASGYDHYQPRDGEFGWGSPNVITLPQFNQLLDSAKGSKGLSHNGKPVKRVAFIHCVGSRQIEGVHEPQSDGKVSDYCSRVCCTAALHSINRLKDAYPAVKVFDVYRDIRTYGRGHEQYYVDASKKGTLFFRHRDDEIPQVSGNKITVHDILTWNEEVEMEADLIVLVTGMIPRNISDIISMLKLPVGLDRFLQEVHPKLRPVELANNGILIAGTCQGPMDIIESCATAEAAASKVAILLSKGTIELDPFVARINEELCDGCELCLAECEYKGALTMVPSDAGQPAKARVNPALCVGCGACAAVCPPRAINIAGWSLDQFDAMVDALVSEPAGVGKE